MNQKKFAGRFSGFKSAQSESGTLYTNIHLSDDCIVATLSSGNEVRLKIANLYELYRREDKIDDDVLSNYHFIGNKTLTKALLKSAGLYNSKGLKVGILYKLRRFLLTKRFIAFITLSVPFFIIISAIYYYSPDSTSLLAKILIIVTLVIINGSFFLFLYLNRKSESDDFTYSALFSLMILNVGIFPLFNYIKDYKERNTETVKYTLGFRSWGSEVTYSNIKVHYYDKFGNPYTLHDSIVNNPLNWIPLLWTNYNEQNKLSIHGDTDFKVVGGQMEICLANCGAILNPEVFKNKVSSFSVSATIHLVRVDPLYLYGSSSERYESSQICLKVPYYLNSEDSSGLDRLKASEIYYGFECPFWNYSWSKLRIPAFNFDYIQAELEYRVMNDPNDKNARHTIEGINKTIFGNNDADSIYPITPGSTLQLSANLLNDHASFYIYKSNSTHSLPLFSFRLPDYAPFEIK